MSIHRFVRFAVNASQKLPASHPRLPPPPAPPPAPPPPPTLISSDPCSPARCLAHRMSPRRPRPAASPPPTAAAHNPPPPPGFPTPLPPLLRPPEATGPGNPEPRRARTLAELAGEDEQGRRRASATAPLPPARAMNSFPGLKWSSIFCRRTMIRRSGRYS